MTGIYKGSAAVTALNVGSTPAKSVYVGATLVWSSAATLTTGPTSSVSDTGARVSFRTSAAATVTVKYSTASDMSGSTTTTGVAVDSTTDFTGKVDIAGLTAATPYYYTLLVDGVDQFVSPYPQFKTFQAAGTPGVFKFAFGSCNRHSTGTDTVFGAVPLDAAFLLHLGDTVYADQDAPVDYTLPGYRAQHRNALAGLDTTTSAWKALRASVPVFTMWDDHDLQNDFCTGKGSALYAPGRQAFGEYHGKANPDGITPGELYYSFQAGDVGFFVPDLRTFRNSNSKTDDSSKTIMGATQKAALKSWLLDNKSSLKLKIICASVPAHGYAVTAADSWGGAYDGTQAPNGSNGFRAERNEIWDYIDTNEIPGVMFISGDQHWSGAFKTEYASRSRYELMSSPFNNTNITPVSVTADPVNGPVFWKYGAGTSVGVVTVDTTVTPATVSFQLYNASGSLGASYLTALTADQINAGLGASPMTFTGKLPGGTVGVAYSATMTLGGTFTAPVSISGQPAWMTPTVSGITVTFAGTPPTAETETFTPVATDSSGTPQVVDGPAQSVVIAAAAGAFATVVQLATPPAGANLVFSEANGWAAPTAGNFLLLEVGTSSTGLATPTGWTPYYTTLATGSTRTTWYYYKWSDGTETTLTLAGARSGFLTEIANVDTASPFDGFAAPQQNTASYHPPLPVLTPVSAHTLAIASITRASSSGSFSVVPDQDWTTATCVNSTYATAALTQQQDASLDPTNLTVTTNTVTVTASSMILIKSATP